MASGSRKCQSPKRYLIKEIARNQKRAFMPVYLIRLLLVNSLVLYSHTVYAWGSQGHQLICDAAYRQLNTDNQQAIDSLIKQLPMRDKALLNQFLRRKTTHPIRFADACSWPDAIRKLKTYASFARWHYVNTDRASHSVDYRHCLHGCVVTAITTHYRVLKDSQHPWTQLQALMFLGHWIGDIHQPLHAGFASDRGGNRIKVIFQNEEVSLHWVWDSLILDQALDNQWGSLQELLNQQRTPVLEDDVNQSLNEQVLDWAWESAKASRAPSVGYCRQQNGECMEPVASPSIRVLSKQYTETHWSVVQQRITLASQRLARALANALN